ncbi:hypothetical protein C8Q74DRAFT_1193918 [Fomes fomentarius]|nr:hypothetical protein C8Q74DRAFT_1193918 [Fomes fomentarius]
MGGFVGFEAVRDEERLTASERDGVELQKTYDVLCTDAPLHDTHRYAQASHPFDRSCADVVLRSTDRVEFRVHRQISKEASPAFERMLSSLPSPSIMHTIDVDADSHALEIVLRLSYPIRKKPTVQRTLEEIRFSLRVAMEYEMEPPIEILEDELMELASRGHALKVWALACQIKSETLARRAVECTFGDEQLDYKDLAETEGITAADVFRPREYRRVRGQVDPQFELSRPPLLTTGDVAGSQSESFTLPTFTPPLPHPDLFCTSSDNVSFSVHQHVLSNISDMINSQVSDLARHYPHLQSPSPTYESQMPTLVLQVEGRTLASLLSLCYFEQALPSRAGPSDLLRLIAAAKELGMTRVVETLSTQWNTIAEQNPLRAYFLAVREQLTDCAAVAARHVLRIPLDRQYVLEMAAAPALPYIRLLTYYDNYRAEAMKAIRDAYGSPDSQSLHAEEPQAEPAEAGPGVVDAVFEIEAWLQRYVDAVLFNDVSDEATDIPDTIFEYASAQGQWCRSCDSLAQRLSRVAQALKKTPMKADMVSAL